MYQSFLRRLMPTRIKPRGKVLQELVDLYRRLDHRGKQALAAKYNVSPATLTNWVSQGLDPISVPTTELPSPDLEEHFVVLKQMDSLIDIHQRFPTEVTIPIQTDLPIAISFGADKHIGQHGVDYDAILRDARAIKNEPGLYHMEGGDGYHNVIQASKIGSSHNQAPICVQKGAYVLLMEMLDDSLLAIGTGNHNYWSALAEGEDWDAELARRLRATNPRLIYTKHGALINLLVGEMMYPIWRRHVSRFESSFNATHACKQEQRLNCPESRIVVMEHKHKSACETYRYNDKDCVAIRPGTYSIYDDWALQMGYSGGKPSNPTVILWPQQDKIVAFENLYDAIAHLRMVRN